MNSLQLSPNLKSLRSPPAFLYVENRTECTVDIYWIDYSSKLLRLFTLKVGHNIFFKLKVRAGRNLFSLNSALQMYTNQYLRITSMDIHRQIYRSTVTRQKSTSSVCETFAITTGKSVCTFADEITSGHNSIVPF